MAEIGFWLVFFLVSLFTIADYTAKLRLGRAFLFATLAAGVMFGRCYVLVTYGR